MDLDSEIARFRAFIRKLTDAGHDPETLEARLRKIEAALSGSPVPAGADAPERDSVPEHLRG